MSNMNSKKEQLRLKFARKGLFIPKYGERAYRDLDEIVRRQRKWIWFDLDKTLFFPRKERDKLIQSHIACYIAGRRGIPIKDAQAEWDLAYSQNESGSSTLSEILNISRESAGELMKYMVAAPPIDLFIEPYPELVQDMWEMESQGIRLGIVTSSPTHTAKQVIHGLGFLEAPFDFLVGGEYSKFNGEAYEKAFTFVPAEFADPRLGMMVGDSFESDIKPAQKMEIPTVSVREEFRDDLDTLQVNSVRDLNRILL
jgi:FMN phosphatase YigB (HAD superfamily)